MNSIYDIDDPPPKPPTLEEPPDPDLDYEED
jgi:hypothetical protein